MNNAAVAQTWLDSLDLQAICFNALLYECITQCITLCLLNYRIQYGVDVKSHLPEFCQMAFLSLPSIDSLNVQSC